MLVPGRLRLICDESVIWRRKRAIVASVCSYRGNKPLPKADARDVSPAEIDFRQLRRFSAAAEGPRQSLSLRKNEYLRTLVADPTRA